MPDYRLYTATLSAGMFAAESNTTSTEQVLAKLAGLGGTGTVTDTGGNPDELPLRGQIKGPLADLASAELRELITAPDYDALPFYGVNEQTTNDGYYTAEGGRTGRVRPQAPGGDEFQARLVRKGTPGDLRRIVDTTPKQRPHQWGTATDAIVGVDANASRVYWLDADATDRTAASPTTTLSAEYGDVDQYRVDNAPYDNPRLGYTLPLDEEGNVDSVVFDTWNNNRTESGAFAYQQVYRRDHIPRGDWELNNGLVRLTINPTPDPHGLTAETYSGGSWSDTALGTSDWRLAEIDIRRIAPTAVRARTEWVDTAGSAEHTLEMVLSRGLDAVQFFEPTDGDGNTLQAQQAPQGLVDYLAPIASANRIDPDGQQGLIERAKLPVGGAGSGSGGSATGYGTDYGAEYGVL